MRQLGSTKLVKAHKNYGCDACEWLTAAGLDLVDEFEMKFHEKRSIVKARMNGWRIMKGQEHYLTTFVSCDGKDIVNVRMIPEIHEILYEYDY